MEKLRIGVIGTGNMGRNHVRNLSAEERFELVGIYDKNLEQAEKVAKIFGTTAFRTPEELLDQVQAVVVAVPSSLHKKLALTVAEHGVHALIEKPLATTSQDAREIVAAFEEKGLKLQVGHIERFNPVIQELGKMINNEQVFFIEVHRYSPFSGSGRITDTSVIEDLMIHDIDLVCHLMAPYEITKVRGLGERVKSDNIDFASCTLNFSGRAHAVINASRVAQEKERTMTIHTVDSNICADLLYRSIVVSKNTDLVLDGPHEQSYRQNGLVQKVFVPIHEPLRAELISFYDAVVNNELIAVSGETGVKAIEICEEVVRQANL